jgi:ATP-dependent Clp protease adapter protein ClpS
LELNSALLRYVSFGIQPPSGTSDKQKVGLMILNDFRTDLEHIVMVLMKEFRLTKEEALMVSEKIQQEGRAFLGYFDNETAYFIMRRINVYSSIKDKPLLVMLFEV